MADTGRRWEEEMPNTGDPEELEQQYRDYLAAERHTASDAEPPQMGNLAHEFAEYLSSRRRETRETGEVAPTPTGLPHSESPEKGSNPPATHGLHEQPAARASLDIRKLRLDATNILTWDAPTDGDPLLFGHLRRFAKAVLELTERPVEGMTPQKLVESPIMDYCQCSVHPDLRNPKHWHSTEERDRSYRLGTTSAGSVVPSIEHILMSPAVTGAVDMLLVAPREGVPDAARTLVREILTLAGVSA